MKFLTIKITPSSFFLIIASISCVTMRYNAIIFKELGLTMAGNERADVGGSENEKERTFKSFFGVHWDICEIAWALLDDHGKYMKNREPKHLLWTLVFYKVYSTERVHCKIVKEPHKKKPSEKTFREWVWRVSEELADLSFLVVRKKLLLYERTGASSLNFISSLQNSFF